MRYLILADRLRERWPALAWACAWTAQVAAPAILALILLGHFLPALWTPITGVEADDFFGLAVALAWWLGAAYYALAARRLTGRAYPYIAAWSLPVAFLLTLDEAVSARAHLASRHPRQTPGTTSRLALFALAALTWGRWRQRALADEASPTLLAIATRPAYQLALALPVLAALWPAQTPASRVPTLFVLVGLYALAAWLFRQLLFRAVAAYLLPLAIGFGLHLTVHPDSLLADWQGLVWALVAGGYLLFARFALRAGRADAGSYSYLGLALEPVAHTIPLLTVMAMFASPPATWGQFATLMTLALLYGAATFLLRQRAWAWLAVAFLPLAALPAFDLLALSADVRRSPGSVSRSPCSSPPKSPPGAPANPAAPCSPPSSAWATGARASPRPSSRSATHPARWRSCWRSPAPPTPRPQALPGATSCPARSWPPSC
ncbi:MAG: hypothetical protein U0841_24260 [Chloroflexia bacterium]